MEIDFDNAMMCTFIVVLIFCAAQALLKLINKNLDQKIAIADLEIRRLKLENALARVLHNFDENDVCSHQNMFQKALALSDARIVLTGAPKVEVKEDP